MRVLFFASLFLQIALFSSLIIPSTLQAQEVPHSKKWALLVGIDDYEDMAINRLTCSVADVKAVAKELQGITGFQPENIYTMTSDMTTGAARPTHLNVIKRLNALVKQIGPDDTFLFYFTGHGFQRKGDNHYLATVDADPASIETLELSTLPLKLLQEKMKNIKARQVIFIIDACRSNFEDSQKHPDNRRTPEFTQGLLQAARASSAGDAGTAIFFACAEGECAYEWEEKHHGVFTYYLLEGLHNVRASTALTLNRLAEYVQIHVPQWGEQHHLPQRPDFYAAGAGSIVLSPVRQPETRGSVTSVIDTSAYLNVRTEPAGAVVVIDADVSESKTPFTNAIDLGRARSREVHITVTLEGYKPLTRTVSLERGVKSEVDLNLDPINLVTPARPSPVKTLSSINYRTLVPAHTLQGHSNTVLSLAFSPDGTLLASSGKDALVRLWDMNSGSLKKTFSQGRGPICAVAFAPNGKTLASGGVEQPLTVWDLVTYAPVWQSKETGGPIASLAYSPDGMTLAGAGRQEDFHYFNVRTSVGEKSSVSREASRFYNGLVALFDAAKHAPQDSYVKPEAGGFNALVFAPAGNLFAVGGEEKTILLLDAATHEIVQRFTGHKNKVLSLAFSPDGATLASGSADGTVILWNVQNGKPLFTMPGHKAAVNAVAFAPDGVTIASGGNDKMVRLWDARTGQLLHSLSGHTAEIETVAFSANGKMLASAGKDKTIRVWHTP